MTWMLPNPKVLKHDPCSPRHRWNEGCPAGPHCTPDPDQSDNPQTMKLDGLTGDPCANCATPYERCNWLMRKEDHVCCSKCAYEGTHNEREIKENPVKTVQEVIAEAGMPQSHKGWGVMSENIAQALTEAGMLREEYAVKPPRPWEDAQPGEVWAITTSNVGDEVAVQVTPDHLFQYNSGACVSTDYRPIASARRIWPEVDA